MDPILVVFGVMAASLAAQAVLEWWRGRAWAAALLTVVAAVAATPFAVWMPDGKIVAELLVVAGVVGWLLWPRSPRAGDHAPGASGGRGAGRDRGGWS